MAGMACVECYLISFFVYFYNLFLFFLFLKTKDRKSIAKLAADMECRRKSGRTVVITQGKDAVLVAKTDSPDVIEFPVKVVDESLIVDTIGAGDAFVGGFFAQLVRNRPLEVCVESGIYAAQEVIQQIGAHFPKDMTFDKTVINSN
jgi:adenosine kinase